MARRGGRIWPDSRFWVVVHGRQVMNADIGRAPRFPPRCRAPVLDTPCASIPRHVRARRPCRVSSGVAPRTRRRAAAALRCGARADAGSTVRAVGGNAPGDGAAPGLRHRCGGGSAHAGQDRGLSRVRTCPTACVRGDSFSAAATAWRRRDLSLWTDHRPCEPWQLRNGGRCSCIGDRPVPHRSCCGRTG